MEITWLGHGSFQFRLPSGQVIVMDPWTDGNPSYPKGHQIDRVDTICITHGHFDHIHDAVPLAKKFSPEAIAIYETATWLESKGVEKTRPMNKGGSQKAGDTIVTMTHAVHSCGILDDGKILYGGEASGYVMRFGDGRCLYFAGDTNVFSDMALIEQLYHPELAFLPIGDLFTMSPVEAAVACRLLRAKKVIPMHFGTFPALTGRPEDLRDRIKDTDTEVWALEPGKTVEWTG
ncbi:MAG TPA: metal-dependent hydrolase [Candidatus Acidoferrales bacterium]|nr:metal-dependent hydrolase [Candidatus Acidoferrales bacterium]HTS61000.1 metal-dependent hydrolase [Candidatus Acidoferrales bacterium]